MYIALFSMLQHMHIMVLTVYLKPLDLAPNCERKITQFIVLYKITQYDLLQSVTIRQQQKQYNAWLYAW